MRKPNKTSRIYIDQWLEIKPYKKQGRTDAYYLKLSNEVNKFLLNSDHSIPLFTHYDERDIGDLACFLTAYFEDLISDTQIWNTFVRLHQKLYGKPIPFFETQEYYDQEINPSDIAFLIWYFTNTFQEEKFISPNNPFMIPLAEGIMDIFDREWEYAPENESLKQYYQIDPNETDYYKVRLIIDNLLFKTYLFYFDTGIDLRDALTELIEKYTDDENLMAYLNEARDSQLQHSYTKLLAMQGKEWIAEVLGEDHPQSNHVRNISKKILGYFFYKGQDPHNVHLEHIASGKKFSITKKSLEHPEDFKKVDAIVFMGIVKWMDEWWFSGILVHSDFNPDLILDEKNSIESRKTVDFLDYHDTMFRDSLQRQSETFTKYNQNQPMAFLKSDEVNDFVKGFFDFHNQMQQISSKESEKATQRAKDEGYLDSGYEAFDVADHAEDALVFFNPKSGIEIAFGVNSAFPAENNPLFKEEESEEAVNTLFFNDSLSAELALFCIEHYKDGLAFFKGERGSFFVDHADFLLRFFKKGNYYSVPAITFTGR